MFKKFLDLIKSVPMTLIGGAFLVLNILLPKFGVEAPVDPAWVTVIISGIPLAVLAVKRMIYNKGISKISSALLITVAMIAAIITGDLFAAGEVAFIMAIGEILEDITVGRAKKGLKKLISLSPTRGRRINEYGGEEIIDASEIKVGDVIRILAGEAIPVDGIIISGETSIDQSIMTGESLPVDKSEGDEVYCGTLNRFGVIDIKATKVGEDSSLGKLIRMVEDAEGKKAPMERIADKSASLLVPAAFLIAVITGIITRDITRAVTVLVVFCPCALVLATPTAVMAAIGQATKHGVIIKSGEALEKMGKVDTVAFDKTGTLTHGRLEVCDIASLGRYRKDGLLSLAASAEQRSEHPLGRAIAAHAAEVGAVLYGCEDFKMYAGKGVSATANGKSVLCGNEKLIIESGVTVSEEARAGISVLSAEGKALVLVAVDGILEGIIALSDTLRDDANEIITKLRRLNVESVLLTGDNRPAAEYLARRVGIDDIRAELLPEHKVNAVNELLSQGKTVCMIGDGVNDAPALKTASVGVAMGAIGSDIAVDAADVALMSDDITKIPYLKRLSLATVKTIKLSITLSMLINILAVALSVLGVLNPTTGALVHNAGSCFVILIAALLYDRKFK